MSPSSRRSASSGSSHDEHVGDRLAGIEPAHDTLLMGIIDTHKFRSQIRVRREELRHGVAKPEVAPGESRTELMRRMVERLDEIAGLLRERK
jgi:hypothetical protein